MWRGDGPARTNPAPYYLRSSTMFDRWFPRLVLVGVIVGLAALVPLLGWS